MRIFIKIRNFLSKSFKGVAGYSLPEVMISTSIIAIFAVGGLAVMGKKNEAEKLTITAKNMADIDTAIKGFIRTKGYIPCPSLPALKETDINFGKSEGMTLAAPASVTVDAIYSGYNQTSHKFNTAYGPTNKCSNNSLVNETGAVPVRTLGLPDSAAYDGWGRKFSFRSASASGSAVDFGYPNFRGNIAIIDLKGAQKTSINEQPPFNDGAIYVLISYGPNGKNVAYRKNDSTAPSQAIGVEGKNTDHNRPLYIQNDKTKVFDDIVVFGTNSKLGRQRIAESPVRLPDIACQNAQMLSGGGRTVTEFTNYGAANTNAYNDRADTIFKSSTLISNLCQNRKRGETISPDRINGIQLWLDANDASSLYTNINCKDGSFPANTNNIGCWGDKSGNGRNAVAPSNGGGPNYVTGASAINNLGVLRFNTGYLQIGTSLMQSMSSGTATGATIFAVLRNFTNGDYTAQIQIHPLDSHIMQFNVMQDTTVRGIVWDMNNLRVQTTANVPDLTGSIGDPSIWSLSSSTAPSQTIWRNGKQVATSTNSTAYNYSNNYTTRLGIFTGYNTYDGQMGDIIFYNKTLSTTDRNKIEEYLSDKWGIPLSASTSTCSPGLVFQKTPDDPLGSCKCPQGEAYASDLTTANACFVVPTNTTFGRCMAKNSTPDYNQIFATSIITASSPTAPTSPNRAGMQLWLDANDCTTITLDPISPTKTSLTVNQWKDKSGLNNHAAQTTAAKQPTYVPNFINGRPAIKFDGVNDFLDVVNTDVKMGNTFSTFAVINTVNRSTTSYIFQKHSYYAALALYSNNNSFTLDSPAASTIATANTQMSLNTSNIITIIKNGTSLFMGLNGSSSVTPSVYTNQTLADNSNILTIGANSTGTTAYYNGYISELILYNKALNSQERINIESYLSAKYDIIRYPDHSTNGLNSFYVNGATTLKLWLDAADSATIYKDSTCFQNASAWDNIGCWADKSSNNNNATQAIASNQPIYATGSVNGMPSITFNASASQYLSTPMTGFPAGAAARSSFVVVKTSSVSTKQYLFSFGPPAAYLQEWSMMFFGSKICIDTGAGYVCNTTNFTDNINYVFDAIYSGGFIGSTKIYANGALLTNDGGAATNVANTVLTSSTIGSRVVLDGFANGQISEIIQYNEALTDTKRRAIESYLGTKWGVSMTVQ